MGSSKRVCYISSTEEERQRCNLSAILSKQPWLLPGPSYLPGSWFRGDQTPKSAVSDPPFPMLMLTLFNEVSPHAALSCICRRCTCLSWFAIFALFMGEPGRVNIHVHEKLTCSMLKQVTKCDIHFSAVHVIQCATCQMYMKCKNDSLP